MRRSWKNLAVIGLSAGLCFGAMWGCGTKEEVSGADPAGQTAKDAAAGSEAQTENGGGDAAQTENTADAVQLEPIGEITTFPLPTASEESEIFLAPISDISDDFIRDGRFRRTCGRKERCEVL